MIARTYAKIKSKIANNEQYIDILRKEGVQIGEGCVVDKKAVFGSEPYLITLEDNVRITRGVKFITHDGSLWTLRKNGLLENGDIFGRIKVGKNTNIGWDTIIMPDVTIGSNCIIGCGALVTKNIPDNSVAAGVPARVISDTTAYYEKIKLKCHNTKNLSANEKKKYLLKYFNDKEL